VIYIACTSTSCSFTAGVQAGEEAELDNLVGVNSDWYPDKYPCPVCGEACAVSTALPAESKEVAHLTVQEAFAAFSGAGLPNEQECSAARVKALLLEKRIEDVRVRHIRGTGRCTVERIVLEGGVTLHLAASAHGACVHRISTKSSFMESVNVHS